ncbi:hydantoinase/oxoprolinase [Crucibulum laeve]|uniref:Hydantoinase/oxoprolinase n=1 Tax=Crucibulum laeve TaxID=68775 RepID=A0A5C3M158_9AGAR|nr:hydantoinase/oxoprolinase [Crucibulum laeve]
MLTTGPRFRLGVDVGGTNTDSALIDITKSHDPSTRGVVASFKHTTTPDVTDGIETAVRNVLQDAQIDPSSPNILSLTIGTTHFVNAVVQSDTRRLAKVAVIRLAAPYSDECPPFIDFPDNLKHIMNGHSAIINGGLQIDGRIVSELDEEEVIQQTKEIRKKGLKNIVLVGIYSPLDVDGKNEYKARDIIQRELGNTVNIVCSRDVGQIGFLERENASILNASILTFAQKTIRGFQRAMNRLGLTCPLYITQNDGTLMSASAASRLPIRTFSSGPTNSMRGASYLAGIDLKSKDGTGKSMLVMDIGGTTTDVGVLLPSGFPRQAAAFIEVAGVRTNFSMPDVQSIGLGGGSRVRVSKDGAVTVGPDSVGHNLTQAAKVFGGEELTATDIAVRSDGHTIGDPSLLSRLNASVVSSAQRRMNLLLENVIDRMKTSAEDCDLLLVGGGSILSPKELKGVSRIITPPFHGVANAVGAAIANISGEVDTIEILEGKSLAEAIERIKSQALANAARMGASTATIRIADVKVLPVQYVTNQATRIIVTAVGELGTDIVEDGGPSDKVVVDLEEVEEDKDEEEVSATYISVNPVEIIDYSNYRPNIQGDRWILSETDLFFIMEGCGILGTGGGGSPYPPYLICRQILRDGGTISIIDHTSLLDDDVVARGGFMGSPSVSSERIRGGSHIKVAGLELAKYCGVTKFGATLCDEIGGGNGMQSLVTSSSYGVPALDADLMGRAYPKLNQVLPAVYDRPNALVPCALYDGDDNVVLLTRVKNEHMVESIMRVVATEMGSSAALCPPPLAIGDVRNYGVARSQSQAWRLGRAVAICRQKNNIDKVVDSILELQNGRLLFIGKIIDVSREVRSGFTWGQIRIAPLRDEELENTNNNRAATSVPVYEEGTTLIIPFQNENLCAYLEGKDGIQQVVASVPDLITVLDSQSGSHLGTPEYAYGLRVTVIGMAGHPLWRTPRGLAVGGPAAFGLGHPFIPIGEYRTPKSVIEEYRDS